MHNFPLHPSYVPTLPQNILAPDSFPVIKCVRLCVVLWQWKEPAAWLDPKNATVVLKVVSFAVHEHTTW